MTAAWPPSPADKNPAITRWRSPRPPLDGCAALWGFAG
jgi:hypothetical protein